MHRACWCNTASFRVCGADIGIERSQLKWSSHLQRMPPGCLYLELFLTRLTGRRPWSRPFLCSHILSLYITVVFPFTQNPTWLIAADHCRNRTFGISPQATSNTLSRPSLYPSFMLSWTVSVLVPVHLPVHAFSLVQKSAIFIQQRGMCL